MAVRSAPRAIFSRLQNPLRRTEKCRSLAASLVAVACDSGDGEAAKRGRKWATSVLTTAVRGKKNTIFAHGAAPSVAACVAPRDAFDGAARAYLLVISQIQLKLLNFATGARLSTLGFI